MKCSLKMLGLDLHRDNEREKRMLLVISHRPTVQNDVSTLYLRVSCLGFSIRFDSCKHLLSIPLTNLVCLHRKVWIGNGIPFPHSWSESSKLFLFTILTASSWTRRGGWVCPVQVMCRFAHDMIVFRLCKMAASVGGGQSSPVPAPPAEQRQSNKSAANVSLKTQEPMTTRNRCFP